MIKFKKGQMVVDVYQPPFQENNNISYFKHKEPCLARITINMIRYDHARNAYMNELNVYEFEKKFEWFLAPK